MSHKAVEQQKADTEAKVTQPEAVIEPTELDPDVADADVL